MLELVDISKQYGDFRLEKVSFRVEKGDYFILLGESGAGKSLVLETIAGLVHPDQGSVILEERNITREKIQHRRIGIVFQDHAVFPHLTVEENIAYALQGKGLAKTEKAGRVRSIAEDLDITHLLNRKPCTLSGGELQRVALGRTLVQEPAVLLLDEPLSSLDTRLKSDLRRLLRRIHGRGQTILHVTHDYEEALSLGSRIAVIHRGEIIQTGRPSDVFRSPRSEFVARFVGVRNFFPALLSTRNGVQVASISPGMSVRVISDLPDGEGFLMVRGEDVLISGDPVSTSATNNFPGTVAEVVPHKAGAEVTVDIGVELHALLTPESVASLALVPGSSCWVHFKATAVQFLPK